MSLPDIETTTATLNELLHQPSDSYMARVGRTLVWRLEGEATYVEIRSWGIDIETWVKIGPDEFQRIEHSL